MSSTKSTTEVIYNQLFKAKSSALTNRLNEVILRLVNIYVLEMEDVLFHLDSCVVMPENPQGKSSKDGDMTADDEALDITGVKALAVVYKQFEFDPDVRMIVTGHTDTSGGVEHNFTLSKERAKNILHLLTGSREEWAQISSKRHRIEDCQQIMKYFETKLKCGCDPGELNDKYNESTKKATKNFFTKLNPVTADANFDKVNKDPQKKWPAEIWEYVYDLYSGEMAEALEITIADLESRRLTAISFINDDNRYLGCGESFPIESKEKSNYRSQRNRRVELLFFDKDEIPEIKCPAVKSRVHTEAECPLWKKFYFRMNYIDPADLKAVVYHLKFVYYDRILKKLMPVPQGLTIKVYEDNNREIPSETVYKDDTYRVKVKFKKIKDPARKEFHFEINAGNLWVYTENDKAEPKIISKPKAEISVLSFKQRQNYYDLPPVWSSQNYWTRLGSDKSKWGRYEKVFSDAKIKPFGEDITSPDNPLLFSFDDIILVDETGSQNINNSSGSKPQDLKSDNTKTDLSNDSRITLFYIDPLDEYNLKIYKGRDSHPYFSEIDFTKNLITNEIPETDKPYIPRAVVFCSKFYDIGEKRTEKNGKLNFKQGHILGARSAVMRDSDLQRQADLHCDLTTGAVSADMKDYIQEWIGNYEVIYLHGCGFTKSNLDNKEKPLSYLIVYWHCRFEAHSDTPSNLNWRVDWEKKGIINSINRTKRPYLLEKKSGPEDILLRLYHFYEAKLDNAGGSHKCIVRVARKDEDWMFPTKAKFFEGSFQGQPDYYGSGNDAKTKDIDEATFAPFAAYHEMGHATGLFDDYMYNEDIEKINNREIKFHTYIGLPGFKQPYTAPGGPYYVDYISTMSECRNTRMRDFWHFVNWINDESGDDTNKKLKPFLNNTKFKMSYKYKSGADEKIIELDLWDSKYRDPNKPTYRKNGHEIKSGEEGKADLMLYYLGGGETANMIDPRHKNDRTKIMNPRLVFQAILIVRHMIGIKVVDAGGTWSVSHISNWIKRNLQKPLEDLNKYYFKCSRNDTGYNNVLLIFNPHFKVYDAPVPSPSADWVTAPPAESNFNVTVRVNGGSSFSTSGKEVTVDDMANKNTIVSYFLGKNPAGAPAKNDINLISNWLTTTLISSGNGSFSIEDLP